MNVVVEGLMANYQKTGKGKEKIVCLAGWGDDSRSFEKLTGDLKDNYTVLALDLPGFGGTQPPPHAWGLDNYSNYVGEWFKKMRIKKVKTIIGHSFGGSVAIDSLAGGYVNAEKLVLIASAGIRNKQPSRRRLLNAAAKTGKASLYVLPTASRRKIRAKFYQSIGSDSYLIPHMEDTFRRIITQDISSKAASLKLPTLLIYGGQDKATPLEDGWVLSQLIGGSRLEVLDAGHFLHQTNSSQIAGLIKDFLKAKK